MNQTRPKINKKTLITILVIVIFAVLFLIGYWQSKRFERFLRQAFEAPAAPPTGSLPDITPISNPLEKAPDLNPVSAANPFKEIKTNPFE